jgi:2-oxoisovalerate dehydrogenase E2 component (dihydrolipoyl transacylase)
MVLRTFRLPDPGEGLVEADIVTWRVAVGDQVKVNDILLEVETSKSLVELPTPYAGTVTELLVKEGDTVDVGTPIISIEDGVAAAAPAEDKPAAPEAAADGDGRVANLVGYGPRTSEARRRPRKPSGDRSGAEAHEQVADTFSIGAPVSRRADDRTPLAATPDVADRPAGGSGRPLPGPGAAAPEPVLTGGAVLAKPPVRKLAKDLGVDLGSLAGSGEGGVITRDDVEQAAASRGGAGAEEAAEAAATGGETGVGRATVTRLPAQGAETRIPIKGVRKATAQAMVESAFTAPHVSEWLTCDVSATVGLLDRLRHRREFAEVKLSPLAIIARAVCLALARTPELNSAWDEAAGEIVIKHSVNLGIATATPRGLVVPNIRGADALSLVDLAAEINAVVATAREGRTQPAEMSGGTFTITNIGVFGIDGGTPILNTGESGILCVGQIARRPWVVGSGTDERIEPRWLITLALSFDHRLADGAQGSTFLANVAAILGDPGLALLF